MNCWYCHWGWAKAVRDIYNEALVKLDGDESPLHYGPGHIVWEDENFEESHIRWCLEHFDTRWRRYADAHYQPFSFAVHTDGKIVRESLEKLLAVPEEVRCCEPESYDGRNPELYPPSALVVMEG